MLCAFLHETAFDKTRKKRERKKVSVSLNGSDLQVIVCPTTHSGEHLLRCVWNKLNANTTTKKQQECIPVGCVPSAAVAV